MFWPVIFIPQIELSILLEGSYDAEIWPHLAPSLKQVFGFVCWRPLLFKDMKTDNILLG